MFWDKVSFIYDFVVKIKNGRVNKQICNIVASEIQPNDIVLECACGTGIITTAIAPKCKRIFATDYSEGMLKQTRKKCEKYKNVIVESSNILNLKYKDESFDRVVAGNVIHLLEEPERAISELVRTCKKGGKIIIPTYVNEENKGNTSSFIKIAGKVGADFKKQYTFKSYKKFIEEFVDTAEFKMIPGKIPCAIAIITK